MALFFPDIHSKNLNLTSGERRFATRLYAKLEDDYLCWLQPVIGSKQARPDLIIMHPARGILVLEVKDWKLDTIHKIDRHQVELLLHGKLKRTWNPLEQARGYATGIVDVLKQDDFLVEQDGKYKGNLLFPWGYGAVLTNITRRQFDSSGIAEAMSGELVICQDEMTEDVDAEAFQERLWNMFHYSFGGMLSLARIDRVRWHLFPEIHIYQQKLFANDAHAPDKEGNLSRFLPELMKVMDTRQEKIARNLGEGHRIIHGAAGSGKTMLLAFRCMQLHKQHPGQPILALCYNSMLATWLADMLYTRGVGDGIHVRHFHGWCKEMCTLYHLDWDKKRQAYEAQPEAVIAGVEKGRVPRGQYAAIMIDEGHDFKPEWFRLLVQMVNPETNSLLLLYDDAQSIYGERKRRSASWASLGIQAQGRTTILKMNYRNTIEALDFSYHFLAAYLEGVESDSEIPLVRPEAGGQRGEPPLIRRYKSKSEELESLGKWLQERAKAGVPYDDMAVLYRVKNRGDDLQKSLSRKGIPVAQERREPGKVSLMSMHKSKGLEFNSVAIYDLGCMPLSGVAPTEEAKVLYVAMTRATEQLLISYHYESEFTRQCEALV